MENVKQTAIYALGLVHGTKNVLNRILKSINEMNPAAGGARLVDFAKLLQAINDTEIVKENGNFLIDSYGAIFFKWTPEQWEKVFNEIGGES
jgi:hypothetical protein